MAGELSIGALSGRIELEDQFSNVLDQIAGRIESSMSNMSASVFSGEAAWDTLKEGVNLAGEAISMVAEKLKDITLEGSHAADVEDTFNHLTAQAGQLGDVLLGHLKDGTHGTITDMDLMTRVNQNLAVGLNLTTSQMDVMSKGAFALSKMTGGDVADALDKMSNAMVTGRVRGIQMLTGKIDLAAAEQAFAQKLGVTTDQLSTQGKQAAIQEEILNRVAAATDRVGEQHIRLADKLKQTEVEFQNFEEELGTAIATSPVLAAAFDAIKAAIDDALGTDEANKIKTIAEFIDQLAIDTVTWAQYTVNAVGVVGTEWNALINIFANVKGGWAAVVYVFEEGMLAITKAANIGTFGALDAQVKSLQDHVDSWYNAMAADEKQAEDAVKAQTDWATATGTVNDKLETIKQKMIAARDTNHDYSNVIRDTTSSTDQAGNATEQFGGKMDKSRFIVQMTAAQLKLYTEGLKEMAGVAGGVNTALMSIDGTVVEAVKYYLDAGVAADKLAAVYGLTVTQIHAVEEARKAEITDMKAEENAASSLAKAYIDYNAKLADLTATTTEKAQNAAEKDYEIHIQELQDKGVKDVEYYNELWDLRNKDIALDDAQRLAADVNSKEHLDQAIRNAQDEYDFKMAHASSYTDAVKQQAKDTLDALKAERDGWNSVGDAINASTAKVKLLDGEIVTVEEAMKRFNQGTTITYDLSTTEGVEKYRSMNPGMNLSWSDAQVVDFIKKGGTLQQIAQQGGLTYRGGVQGGLSFAEGGYGDFGSGTLAMLHGKEVITPIDKVGGMGTNVTIYVNGTATQVAQKISKVLITDLKSHRQFTSA